VKMFSFIAAKIANILSPPACAYCCDRLSERSVLCALCTDRIWSVAPQSVPLAQLQDLAKQGLEIPAVMIHAIGLYQEPLKSLILSKRYGDRVASKQLGELLWRHTPLSQMPCDVLIPIPLHWRRYAYRGFNQAEVMAQQVAHYNGATVAPALTRIRHTAYQSGLVLQERKANVQAAFALNNQFLLEGKRIVLIDDLITTGATMTEAVKVLLQTRPASITAVVAARVM
jgi:ComF family protein